MKKLLSVLLFVALSISSFAQGRPSPEERAERFVEKMKTELNLTTEQSEKLKNVHIEFMQEARKIKISEGDMESKKEAFEALGKKQDEKIKDFLSQEQYEKFKIKKAAMKHHPHRGGKHSGIDKEKRKAVREEVKAYFGANILPVLKTQREKLDPKLSSQEKSEVDAIRQSMGNLKDKAKEQGIGKKMKRMRRGGEELSEEQKEAMKMLARERRKLTMRAWAIVDNHESDIDALMKEIDTKREQWKNDIQKMISEKVGGEHWEKHKVKLPFMRRFDEVKFLLMNPEKDFQFEGKKESESKGSLVYPNPATKEIKIEYVLKEASKINISLYNDRAELVKIILDKEKSAGFYTETFNISELNNGHYFYKITTASGTETKRFVKQ